MLAANNHLSCDLDELLRVEIVSLLHLGCQLSLVNLRHFLLIDYNLVYSAFLIVRLGKLVPHG